MDRNSLQIRRSPLGGFSGISRYERRMLGGASRFSFDALALDFERMQKAIYERDLERGNPFELALQRFKSFLQCVKILGADQRIADKQRNHASQERASKSERGFNSGVDIAHSRRRVRHLFLGHISPVSSSESDGDSSAGDPDEFDVPFWPYHRGINAQDPKTRRAANRELARRVEAEYSTYLRTVADPASVTPEELSHATAQRLAFTGVVFVAADLARSDSDTSVYFGYRDGKTVLLHQHTKRESSHTGAQ